MGKAVATPPNATNLQHLARHLPYIYTYITHGWITRCDRTDVRKEVERLLLIDYEPEDVPGHLDEHGRRLNPNERARQNGIRAAEIELKAI